MAVAKIEERARVLCVNFLFDVYKSKLRAISYCWLYVSLLQPRSLIMGNSFIKMWAFSSVWEFLH